MTSSAPLIAPALNVYYDGSCPLCARESAFYGLRSGADRIRWVDVSTSRQEELPVGLLRRQGLARFHVFEDAGRLISGGAAFARLWSELPSFRLLGRLFHLRALAWVLDRAYDLFLSFRPTIYRVMSVRKLAKDENCPCV